MTDLAPSSNPIKCLYNLAVQHSARLALYVLALGAVAAIGGTDIGVIATSLGISGLAFELLQKFITNLGGDAVVTLLDRASDRDISNEDLLKELQTHFDASRFDELLTENEFKKSLAKVMERQERSVALLIAQSHEEQRETLLAELVTLDHRLQDRVMVILRELQEKYGSLREGQKEILAELDEQERIISQSVQTILSESRVQYGNLLDGQGEILDEVRELRKEFRETKQPPDIFYILSVPERSDFYVHVQLPKQYIERQELLAEVRKALFKTTGEVKLTSGLPDKALHGIGGIGKTVIARAICDDPEVHNVFPDGILWATLGENPDISRELKQWVEALGGRMTIQAPTEDQFKEVLLRLLKSRRCLLIVDDVWQDEHLNYFQVGGEDCQLLLTTRNKGLAERVGAQPFHVPAMSQPEAVALLEKWANGSLTEIHPDQKLAIIENLARLPLALKLVGAQLRVTPPKNWLSQFQSLRDLDAEWDSDDPEKSLYASFNLSIHTIRPVAKRLYFALGIFPEDEAIPEVAIQTLWITLEPRLRESEVKTLLRDFYNRALVELQDGESPAVRLHDLLRHFVRENLGDDTLLTHQVLVNAYSSTKVGESWDTAPDDGYLYSHLAYHLEAIGEYEQLKGLFTSDRWLHKRVGADGGMYDGYIADLMRAWSLSKDQPVNQSIGQQCYYALIKASLHSSIAELSPKLISELVEVGKWTPIQAFAIIRQSPNPEKRVEATVGLVSKLPQELQNTAIELSLKDTEEIENFQKSETLSSIAGKIPLHLLDKADEIVKKIGWWAESDAVPALALRWLELGFPDQAISIAENCTSPYFKVITLIDLIPQLPSDKANVIEEYVQKEIQILPLGDQINAYIHMLSYLTDSERERVTALVLSLDQKRNNSVEDFYDPIEDLSEYELNKRAMARVVQAHGKTVTDLLPYLSDNERVEVIPDILRAAKEHAQPQDQGKYLLSLIPYISVTPSDIPWDWVSIPTNEYWQVEVFAALLGQLARQGYPKEAVELVNRLTKRTNQIKALGKIIEDLPDIYKEAVLNRILDILQLVSDNRFLSEVLKGLSNHLLDTQLYKALDLARQIDYEILRAETLIEIGLHSEMPLRKQILLEALEASRIIRDDYWQVETLTALFNELPNPPNKELLEDTFQLAQNVQRPRWRARAFALIASFLSDPLRSQAGEEALRSIEEGRSDELELNTFALTAHNLSPQLHQKAIQVAHSFAPSNFRPHMLSMVAAYLPGPDQILVNQEAIKIIENFDPFLQLQYLVDAVHYFPVSMLNELIEVARNLPRKVEEPGRTRFPLPEILIATAFRFSETVRQEKLQEGLEVARSIGGEAYWSQTIASLRDNIPALLDENTVDTAIKAAQQIKHPLQQAVTITQLAFALPKAKRVRFCQEALGVAREDDQFLHQQAYFLEEVLSSLPEELIPEIRKIVHEMPQHDNRLQASIALIPFLEKKEKIEQITQATLMCISNRRVFQRERLLSLLVPHLLQLDLDVLIPLWHQILLLAANRERRDLLKDLQILASIIPKLCGIESVFQSIEAIFKVGHSWP